MPSLNGEVPAALPGHPVIVALMNAGRRHELPLVELSAYVDSMRLDCGRVRVATQRRA